MSEPSRGSGCLFSAAGLALLVVAVVALACFFSPLGTFLGVAVQLERIHRVEKHLQAPRIYLEVATNLALYCQSVERLQLTKTVGAPRLPKPIPALGSPWGTFESNHAMVEFGGGFYHYGYSLRLDEQNSDSRSNIWELHFYREAPPHKLLHRFALPRSAQLSVAAFVSNSVAEYVKRLTTAPGDLDLYKGKLGLLLKYSPAQARTACLEAVKALPGHWWPRLTLALLDARSGHQEDASADLVRFVQSNPSYSRYIYLAYFYQMVAKPEESARAAEAALKYPIVDLEDDENNTESRGYSAALYAFRCGRYETAIKLCDALLPVRENGDYAKGALRGLKAAAERSAAGAEPDYLPSERMRPFDPYERMEVGPLDVSAAL